MVKHTLKSKALRMQLLQFTVLLMHTSTTATLSQKSSFKHPRSHMHAIVLSDAPSNRELPDCPAWASSFQHRRAASLQRRGQQGRTGSREAQPKQTLTKTRISVFSSHIQTLRPRRITSSTGTISLLISPAVMHSNTPPSSLALHTHTHTRGLSDAKSRSNWLASDAWVSSGSSVAL